MIILATVCKGYLSAKCASSAFAQDLEDLARRPIVVAGQVLFSSSSTLIRIDQSAGEAGISGWR
jgi:hypothetical protein